MYWKRRDKIMRIFKATVIQRKSSESEQSFPVLKMKKSIRVVTPSGSHTSALLSFLFVDFTQTARLFVRIKTAKAIFLVLALEDHKQTKYWKLVFGLWVSLWVLLLSKVEVPSDIKTWIICIDSLSPTMSLILNNPSIIASVEKRASWIPCAPALLQPLCSSWFWS